MPTDLLHVTAEGFSRTARRAKECAISLKKAVSRITGPTQLPAVAALVDELSQISSPIWQARLRLAAEIQRFNATGSAGELLSAFARAHGVYRVDEHLRELIQGVMGSHNELQRGATGASMLGRAARSGNLLFLTADAVAATSDYRHAIEEFRSPAESPYPIDPRGFALIASTDDEDERIPPRFLAWEVDGERINAVLVRRGQLAGAVLDKSRAIELTESWHPRDGLDATDGAVRHTRLLNDLARQSHQRARAQDPRIGPLRARTEPQRGVVLVYGTAQASEAEARTPRRSPDHRWKVRGHWRRQWYPSLNTHRTVWIEEHTSGPADRPLITVDRVRVVTI